MREELARLLAAADKVATFGETVPPLVQQGTVRAELGQTPVLCVADMQVARRVDAQAERSMQKIAAPATRRSAGCSDRF